MFDSTPETYIGLFAIFVAGGVCATVLLAIIGSAMRKHGGSDKVGVAETVSIQATPSRRVTDETPRFDESEGVEPTGFGPPPSDQN